MSVLMDEIAVFLENVRVQSIREYIHISDNNFVAMSLFEVCFRFHEIEGGDTITRSPLN